MIKCTKQTDDEVAGLEAFVADQEKERRIDTESGLHHMAHAACCCLFLADIEQLNDD